MKNMCGQTLVATGYKQYAYSAKTRRERRAHHRRGIIYQAHAEIHNGNGCAGLTQQLGCQVPIKGKKPPKPLSAPMQKHELSDEREAVD
jgi:hypothetical protein